MIDPLRFVVTEIKDVIGEKTSPTITTTLTDENDDPLVDADTILEALTLTIYDKASGTIILAETSILNTGRGTVDAVGLVTLRLRPTDTPIIDATKAKEQHAAFVRYVWSGGTKSGGHVVLHTVYNFLMIT